MRNMIENQIRMNLGFNFRQCLAAWVLSYFILSSSGEMKQSFSSKPILASTCREENDWDESIGQSPLYQQATGKAARGEAQELVRSIAYYESQGWDSTPLRARQEELRRLAGEESKEVKELTRAIAYCEERGWDSKALEARLEAAYARGG